MSDLTSMPTLSDAATAMARARLARFVGAAFSSIEGTSLRRLAERTIEREIREAASRLGVQGDCVDRVFASMAQSSSAGESAARLMGHTARGECPPYELEYRSAEVFQQSQTLADIAGFYRAFGLDATGALLERADHISAEWEFLSLLAFQQAQARSEEHIECCVQAQRAFLRDHAAAWMPAFFERLRRADSAALLACAADLAEAVLQPWCVELGVNIGPKWLELRPISDEDSTITCGAPGAVEVGPTLAAGLAGRE